MTIVFAFALLLFVSGCATFRKGHVRDVSLYDFQDGDILLQHVPCYLCSVIADVTDSQYSHCGITVRREGRPYVLEAIGPVRYTPAKTWINSGDSGMFTQLRPRNMTKAQIAEAIAEAEKMLGRPYDIQYEWDERKIYCSELVHKVFLRGANIEIGEKQAIRSLNWQPHERFIRHIAGGDLPLDRVLVTPESLTRGPNVALVYSTFPPRADEPHYDTDALTGCWQGEYTIKGLDKATALLTLGKGGELRSGRMQVADGSPVKITSFSVSPFSRARSFTATLADARGIRVTLHAQIRDRGNRIIGTWRDSAGYTGVFSLGRREP